MPAPQKATRSFKSDRPRVAGNRVGGIEYSGSFESIEAVAAECRRRLEARVEERAVHLFLRESVRLLGGTIEEQPEFTTDMGLGGSMIVAPSFKSFRVFLPRGATPAQSAFTLAHELGHLVLHYPLAAPVAYEVRYARYGVSLKEIQANRFAGAFLMPKTQFEQAWNESAGDPLATAVRFGVMPVDAELRAKSLGVLVGRHES